MRTPTRFALSLCSVSLSASLAFGAPVVSPASNASSSASSKKLSKKARLAVCDAVYNGALNLGLTTDAALCLGANQEYLKANEDTVEIQTAFIGLLGTQTHICQVYLEKGPRGSLTGAVENCKTLEAPTTCAEKVALETQKALVRTYPSIAHSFEVASLVLASSAAGTDVYAVETTDEVELERWEVTTSTDASASCVVKSVRLKKNSEI